VAFNNSGQLYRKEFEFSVEIPNASITLTQRMHLAML
jgi:hypothetical protein